MSSNLDEKELQIRLECKEDILTELLYRALRAKSETEKEIMTQMAIKAAGELSENAVERSKDYAKYLARR